MANREKTARSDAESAKKGKRVDVSEAKSAKPSKRVKREALVASEARYRRLFESAKDGILILDAETGSIVDINPFLIQMLGYSRDQFKDKKIWELAFLKGLFANRKKFLELRRRKYIRYEDLPLEAADGRCHDVEFVSNVYRVNHREVIQCNIRDITERKRAEEESQKHAVLLRKLAAQVPGMIYQFLKKTDGTFCVPFTSEGIRDIFGCSPRDVIDDFSPIAKVIMPDDLQMVVSSIEDSARRLTPWHCEYRVQAPGQPVRWLYGQSMPEKLSDGGILWHGFNADITERKRAEEALQASEERFRSLYENATIGIYRTTPDGRVLMANPTLVTMLGYKKIEELAKRDLTQASYEAGYPRRDFQERIERDGAVSGLESAWRRKDGSTIFVRESARLVRDEKSGAVYYDGIAEDITERKRAESALRESNELLSLFIKHSPIYTYIKDVTPAESRVLKASENFQEMIGIPGSEMIGKTMENLFPAELAAKMTADDWAVVSRGEVLQMDEDLNGRNYSTIKFPLSVGGRNLLAGYTIDITERKRAEAELRVLNSRQRAILDSVPDIIMEVDENKVYHWANRPGLEFFGEDVIGREAQCYFIGEQETYREVKPLFNGNENIIYVESWQRRKDGRKRLLGWWCRVLKDERGKVTGALSTARDITEFKRAEEELAESEDKFKYVFDHSLLGKSITFPSGEIHVNKAFCDLLGYSQEELQGPKWQDITHPDDIESTQKTIDSILSGENESARFIKRYIHKNGSVIWADVGTSLRRDPEGKPLYFMTNVNDITERKLSEAALQYNEHRLRRFYESNLFGVIYWNMNGKIMDANDKFLEMVGYTRDELEAGSIDWVNMTPPEFRHLDERSVAELKADGVNQTPFEKEYVRKDGIRVPIIIAGAMLDEKRTEGVAFVLDNTERKHREVEIRKQMEELQRWHDLTIDRELRSLELKREVNELLSRLNEPVRYPSAGK